jgi:hypothetical protein
LQPIRTNVAAEKISILKALVFMRVPLNVSAAVARCRAERATVGRKRRTLKEVVEFVCGTGSAPEHFQR